MKPINLTRLSGWPLAATLLLALLLAQPAFGQAGPPPPPTPPGGNLPAAPPAPPPPETVAVPQLLSGHVPPEVAALGLGPVGPLAATERLDLAIGLPLRNRGRA